MKKKIAIMALAGLFAIALLTGCGDRDVDTGTGNEFTATDHVTLGDYRNMEIILPHDHEVTDADVENLINSALASMSATEPSYVPIDKSVVEDGDTVDINYEGLKDGVAFEGGTGQAYLTIGSNTFIPGFEEGLIGHSVGETFPLELTFPEEYHSEDLAGQAVVFNVTINAIVEQEEVEQAVKTYGQLTDEYVSEHFNFATVQEFVDAARTNLEEEAAVEEEDELRTAIIERLRQICTVDSLPGGELEGRVDQYMTQFAKLTEEQYGLTIEEFLAQGPQTTLEEFTVELTDYMRANLEMELILEAIAKKEGIVIDEGGFKEYIDGLVAQYGYEDAQELLDEYGESTMRTSYLSGLVLDWLMERVTVVFGNTVDDGNVTDEAENVITDERLENDPLETPIIEE